MLGYSLSLRKIVTSFKYFESGKSHMGTTSSFLYFPQKSHAYDRHEQTPETRQLPEFNWSESRDIWCKLSKDMKWLRSKKNKNLWYVIYDQYNLSLIHSISKKVLSKNEYRRILKSKVKYRNFCIRFCSRLFAYWVD